MIAFDRNPRISILFSSIIVLYLFYNAPIKRPFYTINIEQGYNKYALCRCWFAAGAIVCGRTNNKGKNKGSNIRVILPILIGVGRPMLIPNSAYQQRLRGRRLRAAVAGLRIFYGTPAAAKKICHCQCCW